MSFSEDLKNHDPNNPGMWPKAIQIIIFVVLFMALLFAGWKFDISKQRIKLANLEKKEVQTINTLKNKQRKAANLNALKEQMKEMEISFGDMVRQLPNQTEVAGLLVDISQTGLGAGLEFKLFEPKAEDPKEFYAVLPITISVVGGYHQFGEFISGLAQLPRIVTTHEISISSKSVNAATGIPALEMQTIAKTYRALEEDEEVE